MRHIPIALILTLIPLSTWAEPIITGPVAAKVIKVYDGDTFTVEAYPLPGLEAKASVRVDGVDTPEIRGKCEAEKQKAIEATANTTPLPAEGHFELQIDDPDNPIFVRV